MPFPHALATPAQLHFNSSMSIGQEAVSWTSKYVKHILDIAEVLYVTEGCVSPLFTWRTRPPLFSRTAKCAFIGVERCSPFLAALPPPSPSTSPATPMPPLLQTPPKSSYRPIKGPLFHVNNTLRPVEYFLLCCATHAIYLPAVVACTGDDAPQTGCGMHPIYSCF